MSQDQKPGNIPRNSEQKCYAVCTYPNLLFLCSLFSSSSIFLYVFHSLPLSFPISPFLCIFLFPYFRFYSWAFIFSVSLFAVLLHSHSLSVFLTFSSLLFFFVSNSLLFIAVFLFVLLSLHISPCFLLQAVYFFPADLFDLRPFFSFTPRR